MSFTCRAGKLSKTPSLHCSTESRGRRTGGNQAPSHSSRERDPPSPNARTERRSVPTCERDPLRYK